jgi:hypothetical protein
MHIEVMLRKWVWRWPKVWPWPLSSRPGFCVWHIAPSCGEQLYQIILKFFKEWARYRLDKSRRTHIHWTLCQKWRLSNAHRKRAWQKLHSSPIFGTKKKSIDSSKLHSLLVLRCTGYSRTSHIKAACLQIHAYFHETFENVFTSKILWS